MATTKPAKKTASEFKDAAAVDTVIQAIQNIERLRAGDRAKIDDLFNGKRPYTPEEEKEFQIQINVNWQEGKRIMRDANAQVNSALLHSGTLFTASLEKGPEDKRDEWSQIFTTNIHRPLQRGKSGRKHYFTIKSRNAQICMHGIGAILWTTPVKWLGRFLPLEDLLVPTETLCDFTNLRYFAANMYLTPGELVDMAMGDKAKPGWNKQMVAEILDNQKNVYSEGVDPMWRDRPENMAQIHKENHGYYYSDAVPKIRCRWFFYREVDEPNKWYRCLVLRESYGAMTPKSDFLFDGTDEPFADDISQILAVQYGDNNLVAPLKFHTVRGLGVDLYAPVETQNRLRCQYVQSVFEHLLMYFKIQDPSDRDRLKQIVLSQYGILPDGLQIVPRNDRHQIDPQLIAGAMGQMSQIMQESSSSYVNNVDDGTQKEMTAKEATIKLNQATVLVSAMLQSLYLQENFYYEELVRRFCQKQPSTPTDPDIAAFQKACIADGIPPELLYNNLNWRINPEKVLGGGDKSQAQTEASWLWQNASQFEPSVQPKLRRLVVSTLLQDPSKARELVPLAKPESTDGTIAAENVFGTLMQGQQCAIRTGIDLQGYIGKMLMMMANIVQRIQSTDNVGTVEDLVGLMAVSQNVGQNIMAFSANQDNKQIVKQFGDAMGQLMNEVKGFSQRLSEKQQAQNEAAQGDPTAAAKSKSIVMMAQTKAAISAKNADLKNHQKQVAFQLDEQRKNLQLVHQLRRNELEHHQQMFQEGMKGAIEGAKALRQAPKESH